MPGVQSDRNVKSGWTGLRLRIFLHESLERDGRPMYAYLVTLARQKGLGGATVFRGIEGYGLHRHLHTTRLIEVSDDLPVVVEMVDRPEAIRAFLRLLDGVIEHGRVTITPITIYTYRTGASR